MVCKYNIINSTDISLSGGVLTITFPTNVSTIYNNDTLILKVAQTIPNGTTNLQTVTCVINGVDFQLLTQNANYVGANQIRSNRVIITRVGSDTSSLVVKNCLPCSGKSHDSFPPVQERVSKGGVE